MTDSNLITILKKHKDLFQPLLPAALHNAKMMVMDFSADNLELSALYSGLNINSVKKARDAHRVDTNLLLEKLITYEQQCLSCANARVSLGRYNEQRMIYQHEQYTNSNTKRDIHIGVDIGVPAHTALSVPLTGCVHSFADNQQAGDYGPTIILEHELENTKFYTLYGHLNKASLDKITKHKMIKAGEVFSSVGDSHENGGWPPHVHMQIIADMGGQQGDFPGVVSITEREKYLKLCPDPNLILNFTSLF